MIKQCVKSKTMWLAAALGILVPVMEAFPVLKGILGDNYELWLLILSSIIAGLRVLTTKPISEK